MAGWTGGNPGESAKPPSLANMETRTWSLMETAKQLTGQRLRARTRTEGRGWAPHFKGKLALQTPSVQGLAGDQGGERPVSKTLFVCFHCQRKGFWFLYEDRHPPAGIGRKEELA